MDFSNSERLAERLRELVPGGSHTYAERGRPVPARSSPAVLTRGLGSHVWDADGNEFIEYGMGLSAVGARPRLPQLVIDAVRNLARSRHELHSPVAGRTGVRGADSAP